MLSRILAALAALDPQKIKDAFAALMAIIQVFWPKIAAAVPEGGLELVELSAEDTAAVEKITLALSADGTQAVFDLGRVRRFAKWIEEFSQTPVGSAIVTILTNLA